MSSPGLNLCRYCPPSGIRRTGTVLTLEAVYAVPAVLVVTMAVRCAACAVDFVPPPQKLTDCYAPDPVGELTTLPQTP